MNRYHIPQNFSRYLLAFYLLCSIFLWGQDNLSPQDFLEKALSQNTKKENAKEENTKEENTKEEKALAALAKGQFKEAAEEYERLAQQDRSSFNKKGYIQNIRKAGKAYAQTTDWKKAVRLFTESLYYHEDVRKIEEMVQDLQQIDRIYQKQKRTTEAVLFWVNSSWEMAYEKTSSTNHSKTRWDWIWNSIRILRDHALELHPQNALIYQQIASRYLRQIATPSEDSFFLFYQNELFRQMNQILDGMDTLDDLSQSPVSKENLWKDKAIQAFDQFTQAQGISLSDWLLEQRELSLRSFSSFRISHPALELRNFLRYIHLKQILNFSESNLVEYIKKQKTFSFSWGIALQQGKTNLRRYLKRERLWLLFRLTPFGMKKLEKQYYPVDWRLAASHSLYWSDQGRYVSKESSLKLKEDIEILQVASLMQFFQYGNLIPERQQLSFLPNFDRVSYIEKLLEKSSKKVQKELYEAFLHQVIWTSYLYGKIPLAEEYYKTLQLKFPEYSKKKLIQYLEARILQKSNPSPPQSGRIVYNFVRIYRTHLPQVFFPQISPTDLLMWRTYLSNSTAVLYEQYKKYQATQMGKPPHSIVQIQKLAFREFKRELTALLGPNYTKIYAEQFVKELPFLADEKSSPKKTTDQKK